MACRAGSQADFSLLRCPYKVQGGQGFGGRDSSLHWKYYISLSSLTVTVGKGKGRGLDEEDGITLPFCPWGGELLDTAVQEPLREKQKNLLLSWVFIRSLPLNYLFLAIGTLSTPDLLYFISGPYLVLKTPSFKGPGKVQTQLAVSPALSCPRESVAQGAHRG